MEHAFSWHDSLKFMCMLATLTVVVLLFFSVVMVTFVYSSSIQHVSCFGGVWGQFDLEVSCQLFNLRRPGSVNDVIGIDFQ